MEATPAPTSHTLTSKTVWTWLIIMTVVPFLLVVGIIVLMITLDFNFLNWME